MDLVLIIEISIQVDKEVTRRFIFHQELVKRLIESYSKKVTKVETGAFRLTAVEHRVKKWLVGWSITKSYGTSRLRIS